MLNLFKSITKAALLLLPLLLVLSSCEDYLQDELLSETSADYLYSSPEGLEDAVVGLYSLHRSYLDENIGNNAFKALVLQAKSDLVVGRAGEPAFFARLGWGVDLTRGGQSGYSHYWRNNYRVIDRANAIIQAVDGVTFETGDEDRRRRVIGEAKAMRAKAYFTLYRQFNNIFLTTEPTTPENVFDLPQTNSTEEEIFALIESDLDEAIDNLEWTTTDFGRWTKASASHLRAKVAMWQEDYALAATLADGIIDDGSYTLLSNTRDVFADDLNHSETLFAVQFEDEVLGGGRPNQIHFAVMANYLEIPGLQRSSENGGRGAALILPNNYLVDLLAEDPGDTRDDNTYMISAYLYNDPDNLPEGKSIGDTVDIFDRFSDNATERNSYYKTLNPAVIKFQQRNADPNDVTTLRDIMIYRLAETYLISAEAHMRMGDNGRALDRLNTIRTRAGAAPFAGTVTQQTILDERARELFWEGQRWYTLKRMGVLIEFLRDHAGNDDLRMEARERVQDYHVNWYIPEAEIDLLAPGYPQNTGY